MRAPDRTRPVTLLLVGLLAASILTGCSEARGRPARPTGSTTLDVTGAPGPNTSSTAAPPTTTSSTPGAPVSTLTLTSPVMTEGGTLPIQYTCDGGARTPPLDWTGAPEGTVEFAVVMHHIPGPGDSHWYWVLYDIPPSIGHIGENTTVPGNIGTNSVDGRTAYTPPCSKGPGLKIYTFTVYALSAKPTLGPPSSVSRPVLLQAMDGLILSQATLNVGYTR